VFDANRHISATGLIAPQLPPPAAERTPADRNEPQPIEAPAQRSFQPAADYRGEPQRFEAPRFEPQRGAPNYGNGPVSQPAAAQIASQPATHQAPIQQPRRATDALPPLSSRAVDPAFSARLSNTAPQPNYQAESLAPQQRGQSVAPPVSQTPLQTPPAAEREQRREAPRAAAPAPQQAPGPAPAQRTTDQATQIQQSIARIHDACQAPALAPAEYRVLFEVMAQELTSNGLQGAQTLSNITQRAREFGLDLKRDDLRFILEVVSESDPWFEQGASANLFAGRFRNFVVARCRSQGLNLSADELDLVDAWFSSQTQQQPRAAQYARTAPAQQVPVQQPAAAPAPQPQQSAAAQGNASGRDYTPQSDRWWSLEEGRQHIAEQRSQGGYGSTEPEDEFPRIVRSRLRG
jgi:hypothetical protein